MNSVLSSDYQQLVASTICHEAQMASLAIQDTFREQSSRPSVLYRPRLTMDGSQWCAVYGEDLQNSIAGFGSSPAEAMTDFDKNWVGKHHEPPLSSKLAQKFASRGPNESEGSEYV